MAEFTWKGGEYEYFVHNYNRTKTNERAIEVPIAMRLVEEYADQRILEVGNVLNHYDAPPRTVVDRHEKGVGPVINEDIEFYEGGPFDLIVSVSTLEHVGWNENKYGTMNQGEPMKDPGKLDRVLLRLKDMLAPGGRFLTTMPIGYNPPMDERIKKDDLGLDATFMLRIGLTEWEQADKDVVMETHYGPRCATGLFIGEFECA